MQPNMIGIKLNPQRLMQCHEEMRLEICLSQQLDSTAAELTQSVIGLIEDTIEQMRIDDHLKNSRGLLKIFKIRDDCGQAKRGDQKQDD